MAAIPKTADVVVIGAGAAGIAAARRLIDARRSVIVLEAADRVGGRCHTDATMFGTPYDRGARWLYNPESSGLVKLARDAEVDVYSKPPGQRVRIGRRNARASETERLLAAVMRANRAIGDVARKADAGSAASALPKDLGDWAGTVNFILGPAGLSKDLSEASVRDLALMTSRLSEVACRHGLGGLLTTLGAGLPVALATPATRIVWGGREITVETPAGRIATRAVVLTVSSNVLASGAIKFAPELPKRLGDAAARLSLGSCDRIALQLSGNPLGLGRDEMVIEQAAHSKTGVLLANIDGSSLCTVDVAGTFGRDLASQGERAMVAFATEWLGQLYGSDVAAAVTRSSATNWNAEPFIRGAMSVAAPGGQASRRVLAEGVGNLHLAGEATHETLFGTVEGAWDSGTRAADAVLKKLGPVQAAPTSAKKRRSQKQ